MKITFLLLTLVILFSACKKDEDNNVYVEITGFGTGVGGEYEIELTSKDKGIVLDLWANSNTTHKLELSSGDVINGTITIHGTGRVRVKYLGNYRLEAAEGTTLLSPITIN